jgi:SAM-dependent methyltransferase
MYTIADYFNMKYPPISIISRPSAALYNIHFSTYFSGMNDSTVAVLVATICVMGCFLLQGAPHVSFSIASHASTGETSFRAEKAKLDLDVPYEPSPHEVVKEMIRLAKVTDRDVVYDLGCGDGRIIIAAAQLAGARGVGIDADPARIREAIRNARMASVSGRVSFIQQDLFQSVIKDATVVMLFLYPDVNLRLRPKLLSELRPGSRVVSHFHTMGEWRPDKTVHIGRHPIYFWTIPAKIAGRWSLKIMGAGTTNAATLQLEQRFQEIDGSIVLSGDGPSSIEGRIEGNRLWFTYNNGRRCRFEGKADGPALKGTIQDGSGRKSDARRS